MIQTIETGFSLCRSSITALEETNSSGAAQADYIYLNGRPVAVLNGSTLYYLHTDMLGTPQLATDSNQAVGWQASYDAFGQASVSGTIRVIPVIPLSGRIASTALIPLTPGNYMEDVEPADSKMNTAEAV